MTSDMVMQQPGVAMLDKGCTLAVKSWLVNGFDYGLIEEVRESTSTKEADSLLAIGWRIIKFAVRRKPSGSEEPFFVLACGKRQASVRVDPSEHK